MMCWFNTEQNMYATFDELQIANSLKLKVAGESFWRENARLTSNQKPEKLGMCFDDDEWTLELDIQGSIGVHPSERQRAEGLSQL